MTPILLLGLPFVLVIAALTLIRRRGNLATTNRRTFLFLLSTGLGLLLTILALSRLLPQIGYGWATTLAPITTGVLALTFINSREWGTLRQGEKMLFVAALLVFTGLLLPPLWRDLVAGNWQLFGGDFMLLAVLLIASLLALAWTLGHAYPILTGTAVLLSLLLFNLFGLGKLPLPDLSAGWLSFGSLAVYATLPSLTVATAATLIVTGLSLRPAAGVPSSFSRQTTSKGLGLALLLLGGFIYTFSWIWVWDGTDDGVRSYLMIQVTGVAAMGISLVIGMTAAGWKRWIGLPFSILVVGLLFGTVRLIDGEVDPHHRVTEARAARIQAAIEQFQAKTGGYPPDLATLVPTELWWIPQPMILPDQEWCYDGSPDYFRLGALYREHWSAPFLIVQVYATAGDVPETSWECDVQLAEIGPQYETLFNTSPTPSPLPASAVSVKRTAVAPILQADAFSVGSWSPDGAYLVFGLRRHDSELGDQVAIDLHFLQAETGEICQAGRPTWRANWNSDGLREHYAWLADGRLLYVSEAGEMVALTPCTDDVEILTDRYPVTFTHALSFDARNKRVLLATGDAYWLLDGTTLEAQPITLPASSPAEPYRGWFAWSLGGERLALSLMNGPEVSDAATLIIVDTTTGTVGETLPLTDASDASLPIVAWLTSKELLVHGRTLLVVDFTANPVQTTDILRDIFLLDGEYPTDFSSMDFVANLPEDSYYLGVQANLPRNQGAYLYASDAGQVELFQHDTDSLFFFPDGQWLRLPQWEDTPTYRDEYVMTWMEEPRETHRLQVEGHTPRGIPQLFPAYLPTRDQLIFSSSQGISLVSLPDGETLYFWDPVGERDFYRVLPTPDEQALVVISDGDGLYYIPLPPVK